MMGSLKLDKSGIEREERYDGKYLIRTLAYTLPSEDVALGYKQLGDVENTFRTLKTTIELRPMYHRKEERIRSHVFLWGLTLLIRIAERRTGMTPKTNRREYNSVIILSIKMKSKDRRNESKTACNPFHA